MKKLNILTADLSSVGGILRHFRQVRHMSQLDLALQVGISTKHLSFVETGKSKPSRDLILQLSHALHIPYRHQNHFLLAAGYAPEFQESTVTSQHLHLIADAIQRLIDHHEPYPAFVVDTSYRILMKNKGYDRFVRVYAGADALEKYDNAIEILCAADGLRPYIKDWPTIQQLILLRLGNEYSLTQHPQLLRLYQDLSSTDEIPTTVDTPQLLPVVSLCLEKDAQTATFFTMITTIGTPLDMTTQELRIELLFPADEATKRLYERHPDLA